MITEFSPQEGDTNASVIGGVASIRFSEDIDQATITPASFFLSDGPTLIQGTFEKANRYVVLILSQPLEYAHVYTATVTTAVRDRGGNALRASKTWSFRTMRDPTLWAVPQRSEISRVAAFRDGSVCVTGWTVSPASNLDTTLVASFDRGGHARWSITKVGSTSLHGPAAYGTDCYVLTGENVDGYHFGQLYVERFDSSGHLAARTLVDPEDRGVDLQVDESGNAYALTCKGLTKVSAAGVIVGRLPLPLMDCWSNISLAYGASAIYVGGYGSGPTAIKITKYDSALRQDWSIQFDRGVADIASAQNSVYVLAGGLRVLSSSGALLSLDTLTMRGGWGAFCTDSAGDAFLATQQGSTPTGIEEGEVVRVRPNSGVVWRAPLAAFYTFRVAAAAGRVFIATDSNKLAVFDAASGARIR